MSSKSERPRKRLIKLVGGGERWSRGAVGQAGRGHSLKSQRRTLRHDLKNKKLTPALRRTIKERLKELLARKDGRA